MLWQSFLPFGLSVALCVFVSWKAAENQLELRASSGSGEEAGRCGGGGCEGDGNVDGEGGEGSRRNGCGQQHLRPPRSASELRARLHTLSRLPPGPRRLARGRALALAAERALREASPNAGGEEEEDEEGTGAVLVESNAAAALRQTLPWLDARLSALAREDARAERCGPCEICAGHEDARATHAWPCGGSTNRRGGGAETGAEDEGGLSGGLLALRAALFGPLVRPNSPSSSSQNSSSLQSDAESVYSTSLHRACGRCSARCGQKCPFCRREEGAPRLAFLEVSGLS